MSRDGAIIFSDLIGKLEVLRVSCSQCGVMALMASRWARNSQVAL